MSKISYLGSTYKHILTVKDGKIINKCMERKRISSRGTSYITDRFKLFKN